ncbi:hypothetical protein Calag_1101 [Caldisphaera lagunensis DSM 15908]|uniref:Uncharacterized protein n=1 Tax=Caldisphaera lagunensis (strain DSM 15908 / JCM 11604 / ANMR 0165 / IC-154) TaxID=1056495 RepID=L0AA90_CALLD|nr:hypothetical protein [Caldisphaera lagunensis]AFZ70823.1 hypothetical protein Calag_1101 [Caldisphaera lagunensis DSM 15908]
MEKNAKYIIIALVLALILTNVLWVISYTQMNASLNKYKHDLNQSLITLNNASKAIAYYQKTLNATEKLLNITTSLLSIYNKTLTLQVIQNKLIIYNNSMIEYKIAQTSFSVAVNLTLNSIQNPSKYNLTLASYYINITYQSLNQIKYNGMILGLPNNFTSNISNALSVVNSVNRIINNLSNGGKPTIGDITTLNNALTLYNYYLLSSEYIMIKNIK